MRKFVVALAACAIGVGVIVPSAAAQPTGGPGEPTCQAAIISTSVKEFGGRRAVATEFFPEFGPQAVQAAQRTVQGFCASP
jgi:hypothetical protein